MIITHKICKAYVPYNIPKFHLVSSNIFSHKYPFKKKEQCNHCGKIKI